jgi:protein arginine N-methyltransferase 1
MHASLGRVSHGVVRSTIAYHAELLADTDRVDRYREAIFEVVEPGDVVLDIGAGTGLLSFFACQAGAARVHAIEMGRVVALARELCARNGFADRIVFHDRLSYLVDLPERADVLVTETLWNFGLGEGVVGFLEDARRRLLKPGARIVPERVSMVAVPIQSDRHYAHIAERPADRHGLDLGAVRAAALNQLQIPRLAPEGFLAEPQTLCTVELDGTAAHDVDASASFSVTSDGVLHGLCGWFHAQLSPSVVLSNAPPAADSSWRQVFLVLERPLALEAGDVLDARVTSNLNGTEWRWRGTVRRADATAGRFDQTTALSLPPDLAALGRRASNAQPRRSREGELVAHVLGALDGEHSIEAIEADVRERFGDLYPRADDVVAVVRQTAERYGVL